MLMVYFQIVGGILCPKFEYKFGLCFLVIFQSRGFGLPEDGFIRRSSVF